jgi:Mg2+ and Co2+ transporter CorA
MLPEMCWLYIQGRRTDQAGNQRESRFESGPLLDPENGGIIFFEKIFFDFQMTTRHCVSEERILQLRTCTELLLTKYAVLMFFSQKSGRTAFESQFGYPFFGLRMFMIILRILNVYCNTVYILRGHNSMFGHYKPLQTCDNQRRAEKNYFYW